MCDIKGFLIGLSKRDNDAQFCNMKFGDKFIGVIKRANKMSVSEISYNYCLIFISLNETKQKNAPDPFYDSWRLDNFNEKQFLTKTLLEWLSTHILQKQVFRLMGMK